MEVQATITRIGDEQSFGSKGFRKRNLIAIVGADDKYPQTVQFEVHGDKCPLLDDYYEGQKVRLHFDLRGREWQDKIFNSLVVWRIDKEDYDTPQEQPRATPAPAPARSMQAQPDAATVAAPVEDFDEIPF